MVKVLFVCLGNICRSPAAEGVLKQLLNERSLTDQITCDSAGTSAYHDGEPADPRMSQFAKQRGYSLNSLSRPFNEEDFTKFDFILTMDKSNYSNVLARDPSGIFHKKVHPFVKFCTLHDIEVVPDPYHKGDDGFNLVMDIVEDGCKGFISFLAAQKIINVREPN